MIRRANADDVEVLTEISFASKRYWNYPEEYYDIWSRELTISAGYIQNNDVFVFAKDDTVYSYYSIVELKENMEVSGISIPRGYWLDHMFVTPLRIGKGTGSKMFTHVREICATRGIKRLGILADPYAKEFYEKMGCVYIGEFQSTIEGRTTPYLQLTL